MASKPEDLSGQQFGDYEIIGDTGKRSNRGHQIVIARNKKTGDLHEGEAWKFKDGYITGYVGSEKHIKQISNILKDEKIRKKNREKLFVNGTATNTFKNIVISTSKTDYNGVFYSNSHNRWFAKVELHGKITTKSFENFKDAVMYINDFRIKYINPLMTNEYEKYKKLDRNHIKMNHYVLEKQKQTDSEIKKAKIRKKIMWLKKGKGVRFDRNKWQASIKVNGKQMNLGRYETEQQAIEARQKAVNKQIKILEKQLEEL